MEQYKIEYNKLLNRFNNGCKYLTENPKDEEKYLPELLNIAEKMEKILAKHPSYTQDELLNGFKS